MLIPLPYPIGWNFRCVPAGAWMAVASSRTVAPFIPFPVLGETRENGESRRW